MNLTFSTLFGCMDGKQMSNVAVPPPPSHNAVDPLEEEEIEDEQQRRSHHGSRRHLEQQRGTQEQRDGVNATDGSRYFDVFWPEHDECLNDEIVETVAAVPDDESDDPNAVYYTRTRPIYGPCNTTRFPVCNADTHLICYNRRPRQDKFYRDIRQPYFFIDYRTVFCYPNTWGGCSSCSPGRLCLNEHRCILEDQYYDNCTHWI
jgi:hypothetical protein